MKQGEEGFEFVKDAEEDNKRNYIFQDNAKTKTGFYIVAAILILLIIAVAATAFF